VCLSEQIQNGQTAVEQLGQQCAARQGRVTNLKEQVQQGYDVVFSEQDVVQNLEAGISGLAQLVQVDLMFWHRMVTSCRGWMGE
jgi:hypothetical protein